MALESGERLSADTMKDLVRSPILEMVPKLVKSLRAGPAPLEATDRTSPSELSLLLPFSWWQLNSHSEVHLEVYYKYTLCIKDK